ncbi:4-oxalocrotonate tautomerase [Pseudomonas entomophila]|uniref:tautomerase family protein n=1 Tax=Pseudomonas entomophila TaxID=312306 RepID=UPI0023D7FB50|nr:4-oxalocrotonate tautomerase [Pseudomonas entomophila]MDF0729309.1 4-oxalocrotonate tautomerase [Pseudomonas entomophila]
MPHIVLQLSGPRDTDLGRQAVARINQLTADVLGKPGPIMATTVHYIADEDWYIGGTPLAELGGRAYYLEISITDETNTKAEKARFLREAHQALAQLLPGLHEASYIHLIDARAAAYGYGGRTQEWRHQQAGV